MRFPATSRIDKATLHRLWTSLPHEQLDKNFWVALEAFCEPFLDSCSPFNHQTFFSVPRTGRILREELTLVDPAIVKACNEQRPFYNAFTLWNPLALAALFKVPIEVVTAQLLLAVQQSWMSVYFVITCRSCGCDVARFRSVNDISFVGTFHSTNAFRCPMCTDRTEVKELKNVAVFFQMERLPALFQRQHHRLYYTEEAGRRRLESFFCPAQASFAFTAHLPDGRYLLSAPFCGAFVEFSVALSAQVIGEKVPYLSHIVDLKAYIRSQNSSADPFGQPIKRCSTTTIPALPRRGMRASPVNDALHCVSSGCISQFSLSDAIQPEEAASSVTGFGAENTEQITPISVVSLKHGKVQFRVYNDTPHSGFLDLFVAFDTRIEFSANPYPQLFHVPHFMHCLPRGMRSSFFTECIPRPPSTTPTTGAYVRHQFALRREQADDPNIISVLREVHRYSLEDHYGLLIGVGDGGASFESTFLSTTAALASSICFFQRVLTRLGEPVALAMRCSVTEGPLKIAAYQGQYNDTDNTRSSYPGAQFVGSVVYASNHPPITGPYLYCSEVEPPKTAVVETTDDGTGKKVVARRLGLLDKYRSPAWLHDEDSSYYDLRGPYGSHATNKKVAGESSQQEQQFLIRFEVRCVPSMIDDETEMSPRRASACPRLTLQEDGSDSTDVILPYFLEFLREHFEGASVKEEAHALVVQIPLPMIYAALQISKILDKNAYTKELRGPF
ncbi:conserved hypothetical protein [Leishmania major strain Friedlin]|uniref:Uncharacterized protein n=1 Tax=Leishmania major TaxID=5664 RepID=E9AFB4_LEIMA|nr:conserved hypothetical protein [Leishmania major strain Friedlin]CAG9582643.1 hypothetical_protein_-_conserved [Leishmania major strain Friedlin]CBZ12918.1 conserved hypothetical protein [Leishmania major strain Friedlin]|eukprot:XP_003722684.1 conserved hypothetical protein [Leishmania major strain Friedlin]